MPPGEARGNGRPGDAFLNNRVLSKQLLDLKKKKKKAISEDNPGLDVILGPPV